jgi:hypothetical protein
LQSIGGVDKQKKYLRQNGSEASYSRENFYARLEEFDKSIVDLAVKEMEACKKPISNVLKYTRAICERLVKEKSLISSVEDKEKSQVIKNKSFVEKNIGKWYNPKAEIKLNDDFVWVENAKGYWGGIRLDRASFEKEFEKLLMSKKFEKTQ